MGMSSTMQFDVRSSASDLNGGAFDTSSTGTDFSQSDTPLFSYTDLVIGTTNTQLTSAAHPFTSAHVGNVINITSGVTLLSRVGWSVLGVDSTTGGFPSSNALDGDPATGWGSAAGQVGFISFDLGAGFSGSYNTVQIQNYTGGSADSVLTFDVFVSTDGVTFGSAINSFTSPNTAAGANNSYTLTSTQTARYIKISVKTCATANNIIIAEFNLGTSDGTAFTSGRYRVVSVSGSTATMDQAVGAASTTGGHGNLGGSLLTLGTALTAAVSGNTVWVKSGTYSIVSTLVISSTLTIAGYSSTHGDTPTRPLLTTSTSSLLLISLKASSASIQGISLSNTATTRANGIQSTAGTPTLSIINCVLDGFINAISATVSNTITLNAVNTEIKNSTIGISVTGAVNTVGCYIHNNSSAGGTITANNSIFISTIFAFNGTGVNQGVSLNAQFFDCIFYKNTANGLSTSSPLLIANCIFYGNTGAGCILSSLGIGFYFPNNAFGANTGGAGISGGSTVTLTANPFVSDTDFTLNTTAGGGPLCKGAGYPQSLPGLSSAGFADIGVFQSAGSVGAGSSNSGFVA